MLTRIDRISVGIFDHCWHPAQENRMGIGTIILVILVLALVGVLPSWPHSSSWGYGPSGGIGLIVVVLLILLVLGKI
jgi:hypothetical protein